MQGLPGTATQQAHRCLERGDGEQQQEQVAEGAGQARSERAAGPEQLGELLGIAVDQYAVHGVGKGECQPQIAPFLEDAAAAGARQQGHQ
ncbi:hypothetical protein D3C71_2036260 [compost metagenome]